MWVKTPGGRDIEFAAVFKRLLPDTTDAESPEAVSSKSTPELKGLQLLLAWLSLGLQPFICWLLSRAFSYRAH